MHNRADQARSWLLDAALPFWRSIGIDQNGFGVWEAIDHDGNPCRALNKRFRVLIRQAFVFATAARLLGTDDAPLAAGLFDQAITRGVESGTGHLAALHAPDGAILTAPHDLYDLAFVILADASLASISQPAGIDPHAMLSHLKADRGWRESLAGTAGPRRQNPHMHLFEAALAQVAEGRTDFLPVAEECLGLFKDIFMQDDGIILEYFEDDWTPVSTGQRVEPGHMAEWVYLLDYYHQVTGRDAGVDTGPLFAAVMARRAANGLLPDATMPDATTQRFWPQTELLKAALVRERRNGAAPDFADAILDQIFRTYLDTPVTGGWYDQFDEQGRLISANMPASTGYHIILALMFYCDQRSGN